MYITLDPKQGRVNQILLASCPDLILCQTFRRFEIMRSLLLLSSLNERNQPVQCRQDDTVPPGGDYKQNISCILWLDVAIKHNMKHNFKMSVKCAENVTCVTLDSSHTWSHFDSLHIRITCNT